MVFRTQNMKWRTSWWKHRLCSTISERRMTASQQSVIDVSARLSRIAPLEKVTGWKQPILVPMSCLQSNYRVQYETHCDSMRQGPYWLGFHRTMPLVLASLKQSLLTIISHLWPWLITNHEPTTINHCYGRCGYNSMTNLNQPFNSGELWLIVEPFHSNHWAMVAMVPLPSL